MTVGSGRWTAALAAVVGLAASCASEAARGELVELVELGTLSVDDTEVRSAWVGSDEATEMAEALEDAADLDDQDGLDDLDDGRLARALAALDHQPPVGNRSVAFILSGCAETSAKLTIDGSLIGAELVESGGTETNCDVAVHFLAVFDIPEAALPENPRLDG